MVLLPHSAFTGLEGFYIIESAEILHDYHNVPLKNALSMITATRNYIQCLSASCVICSHVTFSEGIRSPRLRANSPTPTGELASVGEFEHQYRRVRCPPQLCKMCYSSFFYPLPSRELSDRTNGEISKFTYYSIIWCMFYTKCHTIGVGRLTVCPR